MAAALKADLRRLALSHRNHVPPQLRHALTEKLTRAGLNWTTFATIGHLPAKPVISAYWPIRDEADTRPMLAALADARVTTALPVTGARGTPLVFRSWHPGDPQVAGQMSIPEPAPHLPIADPDILFVPLAAFDRRGHRIGYGAGHYDCTLARLRSFKLIIAVGIAFAVQEIAEVPCEAHDERLDYVITERELIDCRTAR